MFKIIKNLGRVKVGRGYREFSKRFSTMPGTDNCQRNRPLDAGLVMRLEKCTNVTVNIVPEIRINEIHMNGCSDVLINTSKPKPLNRNAWTRATDYFMFGELPRTAFTITSEIARSFFS